MRIASEQAIANQRNQFDWRKTMMEQTNKDREYQLNSAKHGTEVAKILHDQQVEREKINQGHIDRVTAGKFVTPEGKPDLAAASDFSQYVLSSMGNIFDKPGAERDRAIAQAAVKFQMQRNANKDTGYTGTTSNEYRPITGMDAPTVADIPQIGFGGYAAKYVPGLRSDVVRYRNGQVRTARQVGVYDNQDIADSVLDEVKKNSVLRNK